MTVLPLTPRESTEAEEFAEALAEMNREHGLILLGDKPVVLKEGTGAEGRREVRLLSVAGFHEWSRPTVVWRAGKAVQVSRAWMGWSDRRQFEGITFSPGETPPGYYNLWRGWASPPDPDAGSCQRFIDHIFENVAAGNEAHGAWIMGWFAQLVQQPAKKLGTSLVLRGPQGTGKTVVGRHVGRLLGDHYQLVSDARYLVGRFNSHLINTLLLQLDEATWGGDHAAAGKLKDLVTGDYQMVEYKGKEPVRVRNYLRLMITGNSQWLIPAGLEERRFAVFDVGESARQNHDYFSALEGELTGGKRPGGGYQALLAYLLSYDLADVPIRQIPRTAALDDQKLSSLTSEQQWWVDVLMAGRLPGDRLGQGRMTCATAYAHYIEHAKQIGTTRRAGETVLGNFLRRVAPGVLRHRPTIATVSGAERVYVYDVPPLAVCRQAWDRQTTGGTPWPDDEGQWIGDHDHGGPP